MAIFSDAQLIQIVIKAARRINRRLCLFDTTSEVVIDIATGDFVTPSDPSLEDLVLMQAECMIEQRIAQESTIDGSDGVVIKDGEQTIDTTGRAASRGTFFDGPNPCSELENQIKIEKLNRSTGEGLIW